MANRSTNRQSWIDDIERGLIVLGLLLLGFYAVAQIHSMITFRAALRELKENKPVEPASTQKAERNLLPSDSSQAAQEPAEPEEARNAPSASASGRTGAALALLRIPALQLEVPVLEGIDAVTLNSGVGRIPGTAFPGQPGNIGIAGHRDSFFQGLKGINKGDTIQLTFRQHTDTYVVDMIEITSPEDVGVLKPGPQPELTLVTCYPFSFIGPAPRRFVVRASLK